MTLPTFNIDIIFEIINELKDDGASLFNFLLLNKQICELTIPILWENPFKLCNIEVKSKHYLIIQTYINCLNEDDYKKFISILKRGFKDHKNEIPLLFEYGKYLKEFNIRDLYNAVSTWYEIFKKKNNVMKSESFNDENLLEIMQHKIKDLDYLTLYCDGNLKIEKLYGNKFTEDFISLVKSNNNLKEFIFDYGVKNNISFDYILKCINLRILVLRSNEGLKFEGIDSFTSFNNLKKLDLTFNDLSSKVTTLIIKKAGNNLSSLTIGEEDNKKSINDDTLIALTQYCPNINSLSISGVCNKGFEMIFKYIKNFRLVTLQLYQNKMKGTIMNLEGLLNYIEYEKSLSTLGIGRNDDYWHYYNYGRDNFKDFLDKHNNNVDI
uniref:RNI-like protein n=1 Tax=Rhizophagus irregularis (strain DAOM 181602 / DAOM 197198 / MUCL 43194) TaxID=747089 RepID=U9UHP7_RHIID